MPSDALVPDRITGKVSRKERSPARARTADTSMLRGFEKGVKRGNYLDCVNFRFARKARGTGGINH
jgi:hypothetical protein